MAKREWKFKLNDRIRHLKMEHSLLNGRCRVWVDGIKLVETPRNFMVFGGLHQFQIDGYNCAIMIKFMGLGYSYDLIVNGFSEATRKKVYLEDQIAERQFDRTTINGNTTDGTPPWAWLLIFFCILIPIVTRGGAIPGGIGGVFAYLVYRTARN